jgi:hypothetical protein
MNKLTLTFALGGAITLGAVLPTAARAASIGTTTTASPVQVLPTSALDAAQFNALFTPVAGAPVTSSPISFANATGSGSTQTGTIQSEVFQGVKDATPGSTLDATGLYAYAYKITTNNVSNSGEPVHIDGASWQFNATPTGTNFTQTGAAGNTASGKPTSGINAAGVLTTTTPNPAYYSYVVSNGNVGGISNSSTDVAPSSVSWQAGVTNGTIRANFTNGNGSLNAGQSSATFVVLSDHPFTSNLAGALSSTPQTGSPTVYAATGGSISPVPVPEPATILAWAGMAGAAMLVRRTRKARTA